MSLAINGKLLQNMRTALTSSERQSGWLRTPVTWCRVSVGSRSAAEKWNLDRRKSSLLRLPVLPLARGGDPAALMRRCASDRLSSRCT